MPYARRHPYRTANRYRYLRYRRQVFSRLQRLRRAGIRRPARMRAMRRYIDANPFRY